MYTAIPSAIKMRAMKYLGDGSVMMGTKHRNKDTKIMKTGKTSGTWNETEREYQREFKTESS
jgi:hypothetical protein